jgi:hypothetical protein
MSVTRRHRGNGVAAMPRVGRRAMQSKRRAGEERLIAAYRTIDAG